MTAWQSQLDVGWLAVCSIVTAFVPRGVLRRKLGN